MTLPDRAPPSDADLVSDVLAGDVESFAILFRRHRDSCTRFAVRVIGDAGDADDVLQGAWFRCYRSLAACRDRTRFAAWLYRIVANECRSFVVRRGRRNKRFMDDDRALEWVETSTAPDTTLREDLQWALDQLNHDQREAFVLKHVEDLSYEEMSAITGASESALKMRVKRACDRLRELLEHPMREHDQKNDPQHNQAPDASFDENADRAFAERIARPLRAAEQLPQDFESRLMAKVRETPLLQPYPTLHESAPSPLPWWRRSYVVRLTPLTGLAAAAGLAAVMAGSALSLSRTFAPGFVPDAASSTATAVAAPGTPVTNVRFTFVDAEAHSVSLVGDFNGWSRGQAVLRPDRRTGVWSITVPLVAGRHEYAFIVNGERWIADPLAAMVSDEFGTESSELFIGPERAASTSS